MILNLIINFIFSFVLIALVMKYASKLGLVDVPNERSAHTQIKPRGAGIGFGFSFFLTIIFFQFDVFISNWITFLAIFLVFLVGILDDHKDASARLKFYVIFVSVFLLYFANISIYSLGYYFGFELSLWYFALPFTMFALAGFTNALNLVDGIDGLAGTISLVILGSFFYIGYINHDDMIVTLTSFAIVGVTAFLLFNWHPAKIFMGDSGSLFLGFVISVSAVLSLKYIHPIAIFYLSALPILDTIIVMTRRIKKGKSPFSPDKTHIHHILMKFFGGRVEKTVSVLVLVQSLFSLVGLMLVKLSSQMNTGITSAIALVGFVGVVIFFYIVFTGMYRKQKVFDKLATKKAKRLEEVY